MSTKTQLPETRCPIYFTAVQCGNRCESRHKTLHMFDGVGFCSSCAHSPAIEELLRFYSSMMCDLCDVTLGDFVARYGA